MLSDKNEIGKLVAETVAPGIVDAVRTCLTNGSDALAKIVVEDGIQFAIRQAFEFYTPPENQPSAN